MAVELQQIEPLTDDRLLALSKANPAYRFERSAKGKLIVTPTSFFPSGGENELAFQITTWVKRTGLGRVFPATGGFTLPDTAVKAADSSYFTNDRLAALSPESLKEAFPTIAPTVAFELMSPTDRLKDAKLTIEQYIANGSDLGVLMTGGAPAVMLLRPGKDWEPHDTLTLEIGPEMPGFVLDVAEIIHEQRSGI